MISTIYDIPLIEKVFEYDVVLFAMGINCSMSHGLANELGVNFNELIESENRTNYGDLRKYGTIHVTTIKNIDFCACYINKGGYVSGYNSDNVSYESLEKCLEEVSLKYKDKKIALPILGEYRCDGNGNKDRLLSIISDKLKDCDNVTVFDYNGYDLVDLTYTEAAIEYKRFHDLEIDYEELRKRLSKIMWKRKHGIYNEMPEDYKYLPKKLRKREKFLMVKKEDLLRAKNKK